jgi:putative chitinase
MTVHTIRQGETLSGLARKYNTSVDALAKANDIQDPNRIRTGQQLVIPDGFDAPRRPAAANPATSPDRFEASAASGGGPAAGTTNTNAWIPVDAPVRGDPSNRNAGNYGQVIDQFSVNNNPRYQPRGGNTYCNIFAWDVTRAMGAEIPHWVDGNGNPAGVGAPGARELDANGGHRWLEQHGPRHGWREVSAQEAQALANQGHPTVASWNNPGGIGHIAVVRPGEMTDRGPAIAQAGASNFNNGHVRDSFGNRPVQYFVNDRGVAAPGQSPAPAPSTPAPAPAPSTPAPAPAPTGGSYTVRPGDTLSGIAARHGSTVDAIARANGISNPDFIQVGQHLTIPGASGSTPAPAAQRYTVQPGDTLSGIAARHGSTVGAIAQANGISNPDFIQVGQQLTIPGASGPSAPAPAPASRSYTVQPGDTLSGIAARHGSTVGAIAQANGISNPDFIQVGQRLTIPGGSAPSTPSQPSQPPQPGPVSGPGPVTGPSEPGTAGGVSLQQLRAIMPNLSEARANEMLPHLNRAMAEAGINTPRRQAAFLAQLAHESGEFRYMEEIASGAAYEGRRDLGNTQPGDGTRFKGRGPIQLTGRSNYTAASAALGIDLVNNPTRAADPDVGFRTAAWYWNTRNLNSYADAGNFDAITYRVNGGYNGKAARDAYYNRALQVLGG